jgi:hypothetical protein
LKEVLLTYHAKGRRKKKRKMQICHYENIVVKESIREK